MSYAGYSKTPLSNNQFRLNPQELKNITYELSALVGVTSNTMMYPSDGKTLFISSAQINTSITAADVNSYVEFVDKSNIVWKTAIMRSETNNFNFNPPLMFKEQYDSSITPSGFVIIVSSGAATINKITINLQGWIE